MTASLQQLEKALEREKEAKLICAELNHFVDLKSTLITVINHVKKLTGCEAVSIRLHDDGDYPYYVYNGFPESFIKKENSLCAKNEHGERFPSPDGEGFLLECMCGNIIRGKFDASLPFFTPKGSFWSNHTTALLAGTSEAERQNRTRNYCNSCRYESVALIPIKSKGQRTGLIQLNDMRIGMFTEELIEYIEMIGEQIGLALDNAHTYEQITEQKHHLSQTLDELQKMQKQLVETEKMASLGRLVAGVAHEISTPISVGITTASTLVKRNNNITALLRDHNMKRSDLEHYLEFTQTAGDLILSNLQRTSDLIQSFKQVAVDQSSEQERQFPVKSYLQDVIRSLKPRLNLKPIHIEIHGNEQLEIKSYPGAFAQILTNLLLNSVIHGFQEHAEGHIQITLESQPDNLRIHYQDDGKGIAADVLPNIFDPFFTTNPQLGTGLGLHIIYNLITQKLHGSISCDSEKEQGAAFTITVPLHQEGSHE